MSADENRTRLAVFLGELRAGADLASATVVSGMTEQEGRDQAAAEARGEYADAGVVEPNWSAAGGVLTLNGENGEEIDLDVDWERMH
ncbi:hypothetical protein [Sphingomonas nostoxanthinifaciens]|uniref:hypothetical protein n=1 Tax=Sphingomonas nostoxanthinifaciens TaxID=2872652 RepID=UPI001CC1FDC5|nr:hypothetical protein [Sphingomonas nostoxanthinifaciens]UAK25852.1 hypothetical protein K8P63_06935 [Sphingomonas nostoxanthinifaciens]